MVIKYLNGLYLGTDKDSLKEIGQGRNAVIMAKNEGSPFRGTAEDMAKNAIAHILSSSDVGFFPVIFDSYGGTDDQGEYTMKVVFQIV